MVSYAKLILMSLNGECRSVVSVLSFHEGSDTHRDWKCHKMSQYFVYLIKSKTTCECLTWTVFYKELY